VKPTLLLLAALSALSQTVQFADVTKAAGITFTHNAGKAGKRWLPETMGSGCAFIDADGDGWPDIVFVNSKDWTPRGRKSIQALYRNNKNGTFTNVTAGSGLDIEVYGLGVAFADYDNDGRDDLYITALEGDRLFHNEGNFKFRDVTALPGERGVCRLRQGRAGGSIRHQLRAVGVEVGRVLFVGWVSEIVLHAGELQGLAEQAVPKCRRWEI
jgi:hypothetical protein